MIDVSSEFIVKILFSFALSQCHYFLSVCSSMNRIKVAQCLIRNAKISIEDANYALQWASE